MASEILFKYGDYEFDPKPLFSINMTPLKTPDGSGYGKSYSINLEGDLITTGINEIESGIVGVFNKINILNDALSNDGRLLVVSCGNIPILSGYPTIESFNVDKETDNYTRRATYAVEFKMPTLIAGTGNDKFNSGTPTFPPFIESCTETWDVELQDERTPLDITYSGTSAREIFGFKAAVTHTVDVQARLAYTGIGIHNNPWESAKAYATGKLGYDPTFVNLTGILGIPGDQYFTRMDAFNNYRQVSIDKTAGTIKASETFIVTPSGNNGKRLPNNAIETFEISSSVNEGVISIEIQGEIQGLDSISYTGWAGKDGYYVKKHKYYAASGYFNAVQSRFYKRALGIASGLNLFSGCYNRQKLNPVPKQKTIGINPLQGSITYNYQFDTTPVGFISGTCILSQNITIDDTLPNDIYATQTILGRAAGPVLQDIGTITKGTRSINIELVTLPPTGYKNMKEIYKPVPTGDVQKFITMVTGELGNMYSQVFVDSHNQSWNFTVGRYTRSITVAYTNCDDYIEPDCS